METTPSSTRRVTRSQTASAGNSKNNPNPNPNTAFRKWDDFDEAGSKTRQSGGNKQQQEVRSALLDITNDSPIVGLAAGSLKTPLSSLTKKRGDAGRVKNTPGSGEALLRSQVKNLLQKVEEEVEISKVPTESQVPLFRLQGLVNGSPLAFFAPTPANTPQVSDGLSESDPIVPKEELISKVLNDITEEDEEDSVESQISLVTRSLLLDFSEKSDISHDPSDCSSDLSFQGGYSSSESKEKSAVTDDDNASIWSIQVNAHTQNAKEETEEEEEEDEEYYKEEEEQGDDGGFIDELCNGVENMFVNKKNKIMAKFEGKHTRFVYDSDDEMVAEVGMPTPQGKHTMFSEEADE